MVSQRKNIIYQTKRDFSPLRIISMVIGITLIGYVISDLFYLKSNSLTDNLGLLLLGLPMLIIIAIGHESDTIIVTDNFIELCPSLLRSISKVDKKVFPTKKLVEIRSIKNCVVFELNDKMIINEEDIEEYDMVLSTISQKKAIKIEYDLKKLLKEV